MPRKKKEEEIEAQAEETQTDEGAEVKADAAAEEKPKKASKKKAAEEDAGVVETIAETVAEVATTVAKGVAKAVSAVVGGSDTGVKRHKRAEKVGIVQSDKMTNTVTVRVDRLVKHPTYRKYVKRRKKFMAHDETGATIGDKVRIIETRPLSARKRWRVVEIIQKAEK